MLNGKRPVKAASFARESEFLTANYHFTTSHPVMPAWFWPASTVK